MSAREEALIEQMANALSNCAVMLNGHDQFVQAVAGTYPVGRKSPLTAEVDTAMEAWRAWKFRASTPSSTEEQ